MTKGIIICPLHGEFSQSPCDHLSGRGCPACGIKNRAAAKNKSTYEKFMEKIKTIEKYNCDYSNTKYINHTTKVTVTCLIHGDFSQLPECTLKGIGCPKCFGRDKTIEELIREFKSVHNDTYNYSKFIYDGCETKGIIICKKHGDFLQSSHAHLTGNGCPKCSYNISRPEIQFLNHIGIPNEYRGKYIKPYKVDGYDPKTNTIYEFLGDYWHGNPSRFEGSNENHHCNKTFGELYIETFKKLNNLSSMGYNVKYIWEADWESYIKTKPMTLKLQSI